MVDAFPLGGEGADIRVRGWAHHTARVYTRTWTAPGAPTLWRSERAWCPRESSGRVPHKLLLALSRCSLCPLSRT